MSRLDHWGDYEFALDVDAAKRLDVNPRAKTLLFGMMGFLVVAVVWANFAVLDEVTHADGKVVPTSQVRIIQYLEGGIIERILVEEGELVSKNQVLALLAAGGEVDGVHVLGPDAIARCHSEQSLGDDEVLEIRTRIGLGFFLTQDRAGARLGPNPRAFGHPGAGGSLGFADPDAGVGFGYVMNRMGPHILLDPRAIALIDTLYACKALGT